MSYAYFGLWCLLSVIVIFTQLRWAWSNYPVTKGWFFARFGTAFLNGIVLGIWLFRKDYDGFQLVIAMLLCGLAIALLFTFIFRYNLQRVIPKRYPSQNGDVKR